MKKGADMSARNSRETKKIRRDAGRIIDKEIKRQTQAITHDFAAYREEVYGLRWIDRLKFALQVIAGRDLGFTQKNLDEEIKKR